MPLLKILTGEQSGRMVELRDDTVVVGRHPGCDIRVPDETVSRRHARFIVANGGYFVEDLGSRNGTYLNGERVTSPVRLCHLDTVSIFNTEVEFRDETAGGSVERVGDHTVVLNDRPRSGAKATSTKLPSPKLPGPKLTGLFETIYEIDLTVPGVPTAVGYGYQAAGRAGNHSIPAELGTQRSSLAYYRVRDTFPHYSRSYLLRYDARPINSCRWSSSNPTMIWVDPQTLRPVIRVLAGRVLNEGKAELSVAAPDRDGDDD